jgi:protein-disulfide isomerase
MIRKFAMLAVCLFGFTASAQAQDLKQMLADKVLGDPNAPVTILEFSSFTCPHCATFHREDLADVKKELIDTGRAKLIFRDFPLDRAALGAGMVARCVDPTGGNRYFATVDVLFKTQGNWAVSDKDVMAEELYKVVRLAGMTPESLKSCLENEELQDGILDAQKNSVQSYKINSTPSFAVYGDDPDDAIMLGGGKNILGRLKDAVEDKAN